MGKIEAGGEKVRPLKYPVFVYSNKSPESRKVIRLLTQHGIQFEEVANGSVEPGQRKPLVLFRTGIYEGLDSVRKLVQLLTFWSHQGTEREIFNVERTNHQ